MRDKEEIPDFVMVMMVGSLIISIMFIIYGLFLNEAEYREGKQNLAYAEGKPVSDIFDENIVLEYNPTEHQHPVLGSYYTIKTDDYSITFSDAFNAKEIQDKPLCTYVNIESNTNSDLLFNSANFSADFNKSYKPSAKDFHLKDTTIFDENNKKLPEVAIEPEEDEIFTVCRNSDKGKDYASSAWSFKLEDKNVISQWKVGYDKTLAVRVI